MKYFSYSPDCGFDLWNTAEEAKKAALESIQEYRDNAGDGWDECVESVCWGEVREVAVMTESRPPNDEEGDEFDRICDYGLVRYS